MARIPRVVPPGISPGITPRSAAAHVAGDDDMLGTVGAGVDGLELSPCSHAGRLRHAIAFGEETTWASLQPWSIAWSC